MCAWVCPKGRSLFTGDSGFPFLACPVVPTGPCHSTCLPQMMEQEIGFLFTGGSWKCSVKWKCVRETACDVRGVVQAWRWPLTHSLGCIFLVGERQSSLLRGELTLLLWVKRNQSLKIYLGKKRAVEGFDYLLYRVAERKKRLFLILLC